MTNLTHCGLEVQDSHIEHQVAEVVEEAEAVKEEGHQEQQDLEETQTIKTMVQS